jgi:hypothetical protein
MVVRDHRWTTSFVVQVRHALLLAVILGLAACSSDESLPPLAFTSPPSELVPGEDIDVSGEGCPIDGDVDLAQPEQVGVELWPLDSADHDSIGSMNPDGLGFLGYSLALDPGMGAKHFVVDAQGEWTGSMQVPIGIKSGEWRLLVSCLTLVDEDMVPEQPGLVPADSTTVVHTVNVE